MAKIENGIKNRRLKNYLLFPKVQTKYALLYSGLIAALGILLLMAQWNANQAILKQIEIPAVADVVTQLQYRNMILQICFFVLACVSMFLITITMTHRFLGPIVAIIRHLETLRTQGSAKPIVLRREDEMAPLIDYLQSVDIKVSEKVDGPKS